MANLFTGRIETNGEYVKLAEVADLTFTEGNKYSIQIQNMAHLREGTVGEGVLINTLVPITYTATSDDLYIEAQSCVVNISE